MLSGVSLSADRFFYPNPLESRGQHQRSAWFGCACCPSNVCRFVPAIPGYIYAVSKNKVYINLFISNEAGFEVDGKKINISQESGFPWNGNVDILINPESESRFSLMIRIPDWAENEAIPGGLYKFREESNDKVTLTVNDQSEKLNLNKGYAVITRTWKKEDRIRIEFPMPVREITADERVADDRDKIAVQRGPVIYCAEWADNKGGNILNLVVDKDAGFTSEFKPALLGGTETINTTAHQVEKNLDGTLKVLPDETLTLIPYFLWNNRGPGEMMVWLPTTENVTKPTPAPTIAYRSKVSASKNLRTLSSIKDQYEPENSNDHSWPYYHWWPDTNRIEWVEYDFEKPETIKESKVYWFDDGPYGGCRIPNDWEILYRKGDNWEPVVTTSKYTVTKDAWDIITFEPVTTTSVRMRARLSRNFSAGIHEWTIE